MSLRIREILKGHITVLELDRIRALHLDDRRRAFRLLLHALERDDHALAVRHIVEVQERGDPVLDSLRHGYIVHCAAAKVEQSVAGENSAAGIHSLEHNQLILRKFHVRAHLFVEFVKGRFAPHLINPVESFDPGQSHPVFINHKYF